MKSKIKQNKCAFKSQPANHTSRIIVQIVDIEKNNIQIQVNPEYARELNRLGVDVHALKIDALISEIREQLATISVNVTDFQESEWLKLEHHDRS